MTEEFLFHQALEFNTPHERAAFLEGACAGQPELRLAVEKLLAAHEASGHPLDRSPAAALDPTRNCPQDSPAADLLDERLTEVPQSLREGAVIGGRYRLVEPIGEGGMGTVWVAQQTEPVKRRVAIKLIRTGMESRGVVARFEAERQALAMMDHPNIAKVLDAGLTDGGGLGGGIPYFVMELVKGVPITKYCDDRRMTPQQRLELFVPVCQAIQHAHQKGIIHRDIKPSNVLVALYDDRPVPKVIDFGVAKATGGTLTEQTLNTAFGSIVGTPQYMSPEQATFNNLDIDTRSDVYSLGVLLYELLTGSPPFSTQDLQRAGVLEMLRVVREEEPQRPSTKLSSAQTLPSLAASRGTEPSKLAGLLRNELDWIVMKALEKDRARRYETANGFAADIQRYLAGEPVQAVPPSTGYRLMKFWRKHRGPVTAAALVLLALIGGIAGTTYGLFRAAEALEAEARQRERAQDRQVEAEAAARRAEQAAQAEAEQRERATAERDAAEKARNRTREVLDAMTSQLTGESLAGQSEITPEQRKFLTEVLSFYEELAGTTGGSQKDRLLAAQAMDRVANIQFRLGNFEQHVSALLQARDLFEDLWQAEPENVSLQAYLAGIHTALGSAYQNLKQLAEAEQSLNQALEIAKRLSGRGFVREFLRAKVERGLGSIAGAKGNQRVAELHYRDSIAIWSKICETTQGAAFRTELAETHREFAVFQGSLGKYSEAEERLVTALEILSQLLAEKPENVALIEQSNLTRSHRVLMLRALKRLDLAESELRVIIGLEQKLVAIFPSAPRFRDNLVTDLSSLSLTLNENGKRTEALVESRKALEVESTLVQQFPDVENYLWHLASLYFNHGSIETELGLLEEGLVNGRQALNCYQQLLSKSPTKSVYRSSYARVCCNLAFACNRLKRLDDSLSYTERAIATFSRNQDTEIDIGPLIDAYLIRARTFMALGNGAASDFAWGQAIMLTAPEFQGVFLFEKAAWLLYRGETGRFRQVCQMLNKPPARDRNHEYIVARLAALSDSPGLPPDVLLDLAARSVSNERAAWTLHTLGICQLRAGQFAAAVDSLEEALKLEWWGAHVNTRLVLALAHQQLGHPDEARRWLDQARQDCDQLKIGELACPLHFCDRIAALVLLREADRLIGASQP